MYRYGWDLISMATLSTTTINDTGYLTLPNGTTAQRPNSPAAGMTRYNTSFSRVEFYDGSTWRDMTTGVPMLDGSTSTLAANSAMDIKTLTGTNTNAAYWINLPTAGATQIFCIMDSAYDGGGWMMILKSTTSTTFNYDSSYWTGNNTLNPTDYTQNNADAKFNTYNYFAGKDFMAIWPDISTGTYGTGSIIGAGYYTWLQNNFYGGNRITPLSFFSTPVGEYVTVSGSQQGGWFMKDAKTFSGFQSANSTANPFSSQADIRFYGFNFKNNPGYGLSAKVRWGFGWNENSEGLYTGPSSLSGGYAPGSDDVSGGIGMDSSFGSYSAGDKINCCQDYTGINRSARVEMYVR